MAGEEPTIIKRSHEWQLKVDRVKGKYYVNTINGEERQEEPENMSGWLKKFDAAYFQVSQAVAVFKNGKQLFK